MVGQLNTAVTQVRAYLQARGLKAGSVQGQAVWVPSEELGFLAGVVVSPGSTDGSCVVRTDNGEVPRQSPHHLLPHPLRCSLVSPLLV